MKTSRQLKDLINNIAKNNNISAQILLKQFFIDRFLERVSLSKYKNNFILKGGVLVASMVGATNRATKDMDFTIKGVHLSIAVVKHMIKEIICIEIDDSTVFELIDINEIRENATYMGYRVRLNVSLDKTNDIIQIDITTGDAVFPSAIRYDYQLLLENRTIKLKVYSIENVLAEKIETIITKGEFNTRMKDYYDCYILKTKYGKKIEYSVLKIAIWETLISRNTENFLYDISGTIDRLEKSEELASRWSDYCRQLKTSKDISYNETILAIKELLKGAQVL